MLDRRLLGKMIALVAIVVYSISIETSSESFLYQ